jgi:formylglycine-generating enzyme required for sulfatase activity/serine/threonine protein kinase
MVSGLRDDRMSDLLACWEDLREQGQTVSAEFLCKECPALAPELARQIQALIDMDRWIEPGAGDVPDGDGKSERGVSLLATCAVRDDDLRFYAEGGLGDVFTVEGDDLNRKVADHPDYEITRELGRGGMGVVYLARNTLMGRTEVLKVVASHLINRSGALDRFLVEIRNAARLHHPNVVTAYAVLRVGENLILAMEHVEGFDLAKMVQARGPLPVAPACNYVHQAALGLQHAHEQGIVHRDIKPSNLMLTRQGNSDLIKVLDFGLGKIQREGAVDGGLTQEGEVLGTPAYSAPEQISDARRADIRADIYSLGCTLYYLLTGGPPFQGKSLYDILQAHHSREATPLNLKRPDVPVELAALVAKMMAKEPKHRFPEPKEVAQALTPFFNKGNLVFPTPQADVSHVGQSGPGRQAPGVVCTPSQPVTNDEGPIAPQRGMARPSAPETELDDLRGSLRKASLYPIRAPELVASPAPAPKYPWLFRPRNGAAAVLGALLLGAIIYVATDKGRITMVRGKPVEYEPTRNDRATASREQPPEAATPPGSGADSTGPVRQINNSIGMRLTLIPAGEFLMGSDESDEYAHDNEFLDKAAGKKQKHRVRITRPFYLGVTEVTRGQFRRFVDEAGYQTEGEKDGKGGLGWNEKTESLEQNPKFTWQNAGFSQTDDHPVVIVSWNDAQAFIGWLSRKDEKSYRLPTEAEWEYACRTGTTTRFSFNNDLDALTAFGNVADATAKKIYPKWTWALAGRDGYVYTAPVGHYNPNAWGLFDMHGNVWEWCSDWYAADYYKRSPVDDPQGPVGGKHRVDRGGGWDFEPHSARSAKRDSCAPDYRYCLLGFRLALALRVTTDMH